MRTIIRILLFIVVLLATGEAKGQPSADAAPITAENIDQLTQLQVLGRGSIGALALSSDETMLAVGTLGGVWLYDTRDLSQVPNFLPHPDWVNEVAFSPDGSTLAAIGFNEILTVWSVRDQRLLWDYQGGRSSALFWDDVAFDETGSTVIAAIEDRIITFDVATGRDIARFSLYEDLPYVYIVSLTDDGSQVIVSLRTDEGRTVELWDVRSQAMLLSVAVESQSPDTGIFSIRAITFHPSLPLVAIGANTGEIWVINAESGEIVNQFDVEWGVTHLQYTDGGDRLATSTNGGFLYLLNVADGALTNTLENRVDGVWIGFSDFVISRESNLLYSAGADDRLMIWERDDQSYNLVDALDEFGSTYSDTSVAYRPSEGVVVTATGSPESPFSNRIQGWNLLTGQRVFSIPDYDFISEVAVAEDLIIGRGNGIKIWSRETRELLLTLDAYEDEPFHASDIAVNADGSLLAIVDSLPYYGDGTSDIFVWHIGEQAFVARLSLPVEVVEDIAFNPVGEQLGFVARGTETDEMAVMVWDYGRSETANTVIETTGVVPASGGLMAFHPDGNKIAYYGEEVIWLYDPERQTSAPVMDITGRMLLLNIGFNPSGDLLTAGVLDETIVVSIADPENPVVVTNLLGAASMFIEDGSRLVTVHRDGIIRVWGIPDN